jgi:hypothetical protein
MGFINSFTSVVTIEKVLSGGLVPLCVGAIPRRGRRGRKARNVIIQPLKILSLKNCNALKDGRGIAR